MKICDLRIELILNLRIKILDLRIKLPLETRMKLILSLGIILFSLIAQIISLRIKPLIGLRI